MSPPKQLLTKKKKEGIRLVPCVQVDQIKSDRALGRFRGGAAEELGASRLGGSSSPVHESVKR